jgi:hypothetical protein
MKQKLVTLFLHDKMETAKGTYEDPAANRLFGVTEHLESYFKDGHCSLNVPTYAIGGQGITNGPSRWGLRSFWRILPARTEGSSLSTGRDLITALERKVALHPLDAPRVKLFSTRSGGTFSEQCLPESPVFSNARARRACNRCMIHSNIGLCDRNPLCTRTHDGLPSSDTGHNSRTTRHSCTNEAAKMSFSFMFIGYPVSEVSPAPVRRHPAG